MSNIDASSLEKICLVKLYDAIRYLLEGKGVEATRELTRVHLEDLQLLERVLAACFPLEARDAALKSSPWDGASFQPHKAVLSERFDAIRQLMTRKGLEFGGLVPQIDGWENPLGMSLRAANALMLACQSKVPRDAWFIEITAHDGTREDADVVKEALFWTGKSQKRQGACISEDVQRHELTLVRLHGPGTPTDKDLAARTLSVARIAAINYRALAIRWSGLVL